MASLQERPAWPLREESIEAVVHLAARVHVMDESEPDPDLAFRRANVDATRSLADQCVRANISRFVYVSSVKAVGEGRDRPYSEDDPCRPANPYGRTKFAAEQALEAVARGAEMEYVILRPTVMYGQGVGGNLRRLMELTWRRVPMPFGAVRNQRSLLSVESFADCVERSVVSTKAANRSFLAADAKPLSTPEIIQAMGEGMRRRARLVAVPPSLIRAFAKAAGHAASADRLLGSLVVETASLETAVGWAPDRDPQAGLRAVAAGFAEERTARS